MKIIKTPTGIITIDETTKKLTQAEYDALDNKKDSIYLITDSSKKNIIGLYKDGIPINNFPASKIALIPSGALTKTNVQEAIAENDSHITTIKNNLSSHTSNTSNPHKVTKSQVGLGNVDNTSDINKPVSTAQQSAIDNAKKSVSNSLNSHMNNTSNPHNVTKSQVGLGNVDNTSDINKPVSTAQQSAIDDAKKSVSNSLNSHTSNTSNPHKVTKSQVGLGNVDNTSDINKPVSIAQQSAIDAAKKSVSNTLSSHTRDTTVHITAAERSKWNSKAAGNHTHNSIKDSNDGNTITITYSKAGQLSTSWLASWNGRELGAISPSKITAGSLNYFQNTSSINMGQDTSTSNGIGYVNDYSGTKLTENVADGALYRQAYSDRWVHEIYGDYRTGQIAVRGKNNGTWQSWRTILDSNNYSSYAATKNHTHSAATQSANGLMSAADKKKLDGIAAGANSYTLPTASANTLGGIKVGTNLSISNGVLSSTNTWRGIQNNLTSDSTTDSLSAAQGKILKGLVDSKAASNHTHSYLTTEGDNRNTATQPDDYVNRIIFKGLKTKSAINYPSSSAYAYLVGLRGWHDITGGDSHELVFDNIGIFHRQGSTSWGSWRTILDSNNYSSYAATKNHTHSAATQSANGLMSATDKKKLDEMFGIITITKSLKLTTAWMDTGIAGGDLDSGTYVLQVSGFTYTNNNELYSEVWSGVMTWYKYGTNSGNSDEIILHNAGHADNSNEIYLRTKRNPNDSSGKNGTLSLQIAAKINAKAAENITFKFRRLI